MNHPRMTSIATRTAFSNGLKKQPPLVQLPVATHLDIPSMEFQPYSSNTEETKHPRSSTMVPTTTTTTTTTCLNEAQCLRWKVNVYLGQLERLSILLRMGIEGPTIPMDSEHLQRLHLERPGRKGSAHAGSGNPRGCELQTDHGTPA